MGDREGEVLYYPKPADYDVIKIDYFSTLLEEYF